VGWFKDSVEAAKSFAFSIAFLALHVEESSSLHARLFVLLSEGHLATEIVVPKIGFVIIRSLLIVSARFDWENLPSLLPFFPLTLTNR